jgi:hypothetical protein
MNNISGLDLEASIKNLDAVSDEFDRLANLPQNYNNHLSPYLDMMCFEMRRMKNELQNNIHNFGGF